MRDAAFVKACSLIERFRKESQHWRKLLYQVSDEQSVANKALQEALSKMTKERDAQSALVAKQRHLLAAKQTEIGALEAERDELRSAQKHTGCCWHETARKQDEVLRAVTDERDALRQKLSATQAELREEVQKLEIGALEAERDELKEEIKQANKEASDATARQRMTEVRALKYSAQAEDARREIERLRSEVESLRAKLTIHSDEMTALAAERDAHAAEVESLRAKIAAKTVQWPEWAKEGTRVRVRSTHSSITQAAQYCVGDEFVIEELDEDDWSANAGGRWAFLGDLEPVAEHAQPAVAVQS